MKRQITKPPILITGCARSGTSMIAGALHKAGAFGGELIGSTPHNKKGMFENKEIRDHILKPYLRSIGVDPKGQYPLPDVNTLPKPTDWRKRIEDIMIAHGYNGGAWFYKDAKMCLMWPVWVDAFPHAKWVIVRRKADDIIRSCKHTGFMNAFNNPATQKQVGVTTEDNGWYWWVERHKQRFREMFDYGVTSQVVWPEHMIFGDYTRLYDIIEWTGLRWNSDVVYHIDTKLWKAREKYGNIC